MPKFQIDTLQKISLFCSKIQLLEKFAKKPLFPDFFPNFSTIFFLIFPEFFHDFLNIFFNIFSMNFLLPDFYFSDFCIIHFLAKIQIFVPKILIFHAFSDEMFIFFVNVCKKSFVKIEFLDKNQIFRIVCYNGHILSYKSLGDLQRKQFNVTSDVLVHKYFHRSNNETF